VAAFAALLRAPPPAAFTYHHSAKLYSGSVSCCAAGNLCPFFAA